MTIDLVFERAIQRGDYQRVLLDAAQSGGVRVLTDSDVVNVEAGTNELEGCQVVILKNGRRLDADVVVGADGIMLEGFPDN